MDDAGSTRAAGRPGLHRGGRARARHRPDRLGQPASATSIRTGASTPAQGWFLAGDGAKYDDDGDIWILGRVDDTLNVSGHLLSTIEIESALVSHPAVVEAGVCPVDGPEDRPRRRRVRGAADKSLIAADVPADGDQDAVPSCATTWRSAIGPIAKPRDVVVVPDVPKTRSGKIMRRLLTQLFEGTTLGDTTSLQNEPSIADIQAICQWRGRRRGGTGVPCPPAPPPCWPARAPATIRSLPRSQLRPTHAFRLVRAIRPFRNVES